MTRARYGPTNRGIQGILETRVLGSLDSAVGPSEVA